jgi:hypothetical protein
LEEEMNLQFCLTIDGKETVCGIDERVITDYAIQAKFDNPNAEVRVLKCGERYLLIDWMESSRKVA